MKTPDELKAVAWKYLIKNGLTPEGTAGLMGNMERESDGFHTDRVEYLCLKRLKEQGKIYTDSTYTAFVDDGTISKEEFLHPIPGRQYGYGLCQWTSPIRKAGLYDLCKSRNVSISDLQAQLDFLLHELQTDYKGVYQVLQSTRDILTASNYVLTHFEQPANTDSAVRKVRYSAAKKIYETFAGDNTKAINKVIEIATEEIGYLEKKSNADLYSKTGNAGSGNFTKYWAETYPQFQGQPWCADFVSWCMMQAFGKDTATKLLKHWPFVYCPTLASKTTNKVPEVGSIVLFFRSGTYTHTGLVTEVGTGTITTIEGNTSGASGIIANGGGVCKKTYMTADLSNLTKYFVPDYSIVEEEKMLYYVRSSWLDTGSQTYKGNDLDAAKAAAKKNKQLYVFSVTGKILYPAPKTVKARRERAVQWANAVAKDKRHGYDNRQDYRWGQNGDFACSSLVITAYEQAGVPVKAKGATVTSNMRAAFLQAGFSDVTKDVNFKNCSGMVRGDVVLTPGYHTEIYIGTKRLIGARGNAYGDTPEHGKSGDQGGEIVKSGYYDYPWEFCLRYVGIPKDTIVQAGSYERRPNAETLKKIIKSKLDVTMYIVKVGGWYTVRSKAMTKDEAKALAGKLKAKGFEAILV